MKLLPRPALVSILNNKAVGYIEKRQYNRATKSLSRALRMAEKESNASSNKRQRVAKILSIGSPPDPSPEEDTSTVEGVVIATLLNVSRVFAHG